MQGSWRNSGASLPGLTAQATRRAEGRYLMERLEKLGLSPVQDEAGNVMADVPPFRAGRGLPCADLAGTYGYGGHRSAGQRL